MFSEKLDALMNIAEVSNTLLGQKINMNNSYIGRLRKGIRPLPKKHDFIESMCDYLSKRITKEYQLTALHNLTNISGITTSTQTEMAIFLKIWLLQENDAQYQSANRFVSGLARAISAPLTNNHNLAQDNHNPIKYIPYYYGNEGKRKAVEQFFLTILEEKEPQMLLLFSDENISWLYEDENYAKLWMNLFKQILIKGNRVKIIHTINRNTNELFEAILKWLPIYMTGMVEPYYFSHIRDGVFQRTVFLAPKTAAILSTCVSQETNGMLNQFITDKTALLAIDTEYQNFLSVCKPLMRIYQNQNLQDCITEIQLMSIQSGNAMIHYAMPLLFSMPQRLALEITEQQNAPLIIELWKICTSTFKKNIKENKVTQTILPLDFSLLRPDLLTFPFCETMGIDTFTYTIEQYEEHFNHLLTLQKKYDKFTVLQNDKLSTDTCIYTKEDFGLVIAKNNTPSIVFVTKEQNMVNAFVDYLNFQKNSHPS